MAADLLQPLPQNHAPDREIDLWETFETLWKGKWKIAGLTLVPCLIAVIFLLNVKVQFEATTTILPISKIASDDYAESNSMGFFKVTREDLEGLFIDQLTSGGVIEDVSEQVGLVERERFESDSEYREAIREFVELSVAVLPPINEDGLNNGVSRPNWQIVAVHSDRGKWLQALEHIRDESNKAIITALRKRFATDISIAENRRAFELEDLATRVKNVELDYDLDMRQLETRLAFDLEDVTTKIKNALVDYDRSTSDRLEFLKEQAAIARKLGVAKNTIEAQTFSAQGGVLASVDTDTPFYLRGYEAIEKEIELMKARDNKRAFVAELAELEAAKREIEQDQTLARMEFEKRFLGQKLELQRRIRDLEQDQTIERVKTLFALTPISTGEDFMAARLVPEGTRFNYKTSKATTLVLVGLVSGMLSCVYVLASSAMRKRKIRETRADA